MTCSKVPYNSKKEAMKDGKAIQVNNRFRSRKFKANKKLGKKFYSYQCRRCNRWHLTTQKPRGK